MIVPAKLADVYVPEGRGAPLTRDTLYMQAPLQLDLWLQPVRGSWILVERAARLAANLELVTSEGGIHFIAHIVPLAAVADNYSLHSHRNPCMLGSSARLFRSYVRDLANDEKDGR